MPSDSGTDIKELALAEGLRAAVGIAIPIAIGLLANHLVWGNLCAFGTFWVLSCDVGGAYRQKAISDYPTREPIQLESDDLTGLVEALAKGLDDLAASLEKGTDPGRGAKRGVAATTSYSSSYFRLQF